MKKFEDRIDKKEKQTWEEFTYHVRTKRYMAVWRIEMIERICTMHVCKTNNASLSVAIISCAVDRNLGCENKHCLRWRVELTMGGQNKEIDIGWGYH